MKTTFESAHFAARISTGAGVLIEVTGDLDLASVPTFEAAVRDLDPSCRRSVVLDLGRLAFIDAAGLHAVLDLHEHCLNVATVLMILPGPWHVQRVFELTETEQLVSFRRSAKRGSNRASAPGSDRQSRPHERDAAAPRREP